MEWSDTYGISQYDRKSRRGQMSVYLGLRMELSILVLVITTQLRVGETLYTDLVLSPNAMSWSKSETYCQGQNGRLLVLDSKEKWDQFTSHEEYRKNDIVNKDCWIGMKFNDTVQCNYTNGRKQWQYSGWSRWADGTWEPNYCPKKKCVELKNNEMYTVYCYKQLLAICEIARQFPFTDLVLSPQAMSRDDSENFCQNQNGRLIVLDSQEKWDYFTAHEDYIKNDIHLGAYWIGMKFADTVQCNTTETHTPWIYDGWGKWRDKYSEPNECPFDRCVLLKTNSMQTRQCNHLHIALCELVQSTTELSTTHSQSTTEVSFTVPSTPTSTPHGTGDNSVVSSTTFKSQETNTTAPASTTSSTSSAENMTSSIPVTTTDAETMMSSILVTTSTTGTEKTTKPISTTPATTVLPVSSEAVNDSCRQCCFVVNKTRALNEQEKEVIRHELRVQLAVNKTILSSYIRKLTSVYDSRPSSVAIGGVACVFLAAVVGVIIIPDCVTLFRFLYRYVGSDQVLSGINQ